MPPPARPHGPLGVQPGVGTSCRRRAVTAMARHLAQPLLPAGKFRGGGKLITTCNLCSLPRQDAAGMKSTQVMESRG